MKRDRWGMEWKEVSKRIVWRELGYRGVKAEASEERKVSIRANKRPWVRCKMWGMSCNHIRHSSAHCLNTRLGSLCVMIIMCIISCNQRWTDPFSPFCKSLYCLIGCTRTELSQQHVNLTSSKLEYLWKITSYNVSKIKPLMVSSILFKKICNFFLQMSALLVQIRLAMEFLED